MAGAHAKGGRATFQGRGMVQTKQPTGRHAKPSATAPPQPQATKPAPKGTGTDSGKAGPTWGGVAKRGASFTGQTWDFAKGQGGKEGNQGIVGLMLLTFTIVAIAHIRGQKKIDVKHALFGGFVLLFILSGLNQINHKLAFGFAVLVTIMALLEYGSAAFNGLLTASAKSTPAPGAPGSNASVFHIPATQTRVSTSDPNVSNSTGQGFDYNSGNGLITHYVYPNPS